MDKIKVYYLINQKLDKRNIKRFFFDYFFKKNIEVVVINFFFQKKTRFKNFKYFYFKSNKFKILKNITNFKPNYFIDLTQKKTSEVFFQLFLRFCGIKRVTINTGLIPVENLKHGLIKYSIINESFIKILNKVISRIYYKILITFLLPKSFLSFVSGKKGFNLAKKRGDVVIIKSHNLDYDEYILSKKKIPFKSNYFVYVDQDFHNSIDLKMDDMYFKNSKNFEKKIKLFLSSIKKKIIVAGSNRRQKKIKLFHKKTIYLKTHNLIKNCKLVIGHNSTALQYAVLYNKPILLLSTKELKKIPLIYENIISFKKELRCNYLNIDKEKFFLKKVNMKIDKKLYKKYISKYVNENILSNKSSFDILSKYYKKYSYEKL